MAHHAHGALEVLGGEHLVQGFPGQRFTGFVVAGNQRQALFGPAPVFQELAGQLHRVPGHAVNTGDAGHFLLGEHVVQPMAELVEQGDHFVVGEQAGLAAGRRREVAGQVGDRGLQFAVQTAAAHPGVVHPGPAALAVACVHIEVESGAHAAVVVHQFKEAHVRVPGVHVVTLAEADAEQLADHLEHAVDHFLRREPGAQRFVGKVVAGFAQTLAPVAQVPGLQIVGALLGGERLQGRHFPFRLGFGAAGQVVEKADHLIHVAGHFGGQGFVRVVGETEQVSLLVAQLEDLVHHRAVVVFTGLRALVGGAGGEGPVHLFAQGAVLGVAHHREEHREVEGQQPALFQALGAGAVGGAGQGGVRQPGQFRFIGNVLLPGLGGVQQVVLEAGGQLRQPLGVLHVLRLLRFGQGHAGEAEVAQRVVDVFLLGRCQGVEFVAVAQRLVGGEQLAVLAHFGAVLADQRQAGVVRFAQRFVLGHGIQMPHRAEGLFQALVFLGQGQFQSPVAEVTVGQHLADALAARFHQLFHRRFHMLRADFGEGRQVRVINQRVVTHGASRYNGSDSS